MVYRRGKVVRQGRALSFYYFAPTTTIVRIPQGANEAPFFFEHSTVDYQIATVQGHVVYGISAPDKAAERVDFRLTTDGNYYASDAPEKLADIVVNSAGMLVAEYLRGVSLSEALRGAEDLASRLRQRLTDSPVIQSLGLEVVDVIVDHIKPAPETARALEAKAREEIMQEADVAMHRRRTASVSQDREIKEAELETEKTVALRRREIIETEMETRRVEQERNHELERAQTEAEIQQAQRRKELIQQEADNTRVTADAKAYATRTVINALGDVDARVLEAIATSGMDSHKLVARAFRELARNAEKIGNFTLTPDLLRDVLEQRPSRRS